MGEYYTNKRPGHKDAKFFIGKEVERTPAYGLKTLFVVFTHSPIRIVNSAIDEQCEHIYFGADRSFNSTERFAEQWQDMIQHALDSGFWVTADFNVNWPHIEYVMRQENGGYYSRMPKLMQHEKFIPMMSVHLPKVSTMMNKNAIIKVDDYMDNPTNPGVWCAPLSNIVNDQGFTDWKKYEDDEIIKTEESI